RNVRPVACGARDTPPILSPRPISAIPATATSLAPASAQQTYQRDGRTVTDATRQKTVTPAGQQTLTGTPNRNVNNTGARSRQVATSTPADQPSRTPRGDPRGKNPAAPVP